MKYLLIIALIVGGYYYYQKSNLFTHEKIVASIAGKEGKICSNQAMLEDKKMTASQCKSTFESKFQSCVSAMNQKYPGDRFDSVDQEEKAGSQLANCVTSRE